MKNKKETVIVNEETAQVLEETLTEVSKSEEKESSNEKPTPKSYPVEDLPRIWNEQVPIRVNNLRSNDVLYEYGSKNLTKMVMFLMRVKITKDQIEHWLDSQKYPAARNADELYDDYKLRQKFQAALIKYRKEVKSFAIMHMMQDFIEKQKEEKKDEVVNEIKEQNKSLNEKTESHE